MGLSTIGLGNSKLGDARLNTGLGLYEPIFNAQDIQGLQLWLDAADIATITESSGSVSSWNDKSGNGNNATQGIGVDQPVSGDTTQNGLNVIDFDGGDSLSLPSSIYPLAGGNVTIFAVSVTSLNNQTQRLISWNNSGSTTFMHLLYSSTVSRISFSADGSVNDNGITETNWNILKGRREATTIAASYNGNTESTSTGGADLTATGAFIGSRNLDGTVQALTGSIGEVLVYNRSLSSAESYVIENYLASKWGISI